MPRSPMTPAEADDVRGRILQEAAAIVAEEGLAGLSMRHLASKLGMTAGALYRYFPSRQDLILAHFGKGMGELYGRLKEREASTDPLTALRDFAMAYADFALSDPVRFRLMFLEDNQATQNAGLKFATVAEAYGEFIRRTEAAIDACALGPGEAKPKTDVLYAGLHGAVTLAITASELEFGSPQAFVERTIDTILDGLSRKEPKP